MFLENPIVSDSGAGWLLFVLAIAMFLYGIAAEFRDPPPENITPYQIVGIAGFVLVLIMNPICAG